MAQSRRTSKTPLIAVAQMKSTNDKEHNLDQVRTITERGKAKDAQVLDAIRPLPLDSCPGSLPDGLMLPGLFSLFSFQSVATLSGRIEKKRCDCRNH